MCQIFCRKASQRLTQAIKSLDRTLDEVKSDTRNTEERLSELSVSVSVLIIVDGLLKYLSFLGRHDYRNDTEAYKNTYSYSRYFRS